MSNKPYLELVDPRADARELARLAALTDRQTVRDLLLSHVSGCLVAAKVMEESGDIPPAQSPNL